ncbi:hypothetical protein BDN70DRAFT_818934 [Pholiota conissans]|uniref:Ser-Thr-rich glycosyl-phosphatidyl-inositol-anchored membrane family-domain-containing protein n=1 Tax=Pholiota conissans TaxID=109636 RepID=A0A9P6CMF7_9AGAR|nr:hypothetical protein BDN70DRAFT_818934 [Pholiota conissans]
MFAQLRIHATLFAALLFTVCVKASPLALDRRDVIRPKITSPNAGSVWPIGSTQTVTWDTSDFPPVSQITNILGKVILGRDANDSLNLDFDHPLAQNFNLTDGSVKVTVPNVQPGADYLIVLFGDSGNTSPDFSITNITVPSTAATSSSPSSTGTLITTPIPITGSTITGGDSTTSTTATDAPTTTDTTTTDTSTDTATSPVTTPTSPVSTSSTSTSTSTSATTATTTTSAAYRASGMGTKTLSLFVCSALAFVLV